jgi:hypothetical protein
MYLGVATIEVGENCGPILERHPGRYRGVFIEIREDFNIRVI